MCLIFVTKTRYEDISTTKISWFTVGVDNDWVCAALTTCMLMCISFPSTPYPHPLTHTQPLSLSRINSPTSRHRVEQLKKVRHTHTSDVHVHVQYMCVGGWFVSKLPLSVILLFPLLYNELTILVWVCVCLWRVGDYSACSLHLH